MASSSLGCKGGEGGPSPASGAETSRLAVLLRHTGPKQRREAPDPPGVVGSHNRRSEAPGLQGSPGGVPACHTHLFSPLWLENTAPNSDLLPSRGTACVPLPVPETQTGFWQGGGGGDTLGLPKLRPERPRGLRFSSGAPRWSPGCSRERPTALRPRSREEAQTGPQAKRTWRA